MKTRKLISLAIVLTMLVHVFSIYTYSIEIGDDMIPVDSSLYTVIPVDVAEVMAQFFISDMALVDGNTWTSHTTISDNVVMYDETGCVSAYAFELTTLNEDNGYIIVSANSSLSNKILEYSDTASPMYDNLAIGETDTVIYTGGYNYYKFNGNAVTNLLGEIIEADEIVPISARLSTAELGITQITDTNYNTNSMYPIGSIIAWANTYYQGPFSVSEHMNPFDSSDMSFEITTDYSDAGNCSIVAITNEIITLGNHHQKTTVTSKTPAQIYSTVKSVGVSNGYYTGNGTYPEYIENYIENAFGEYFSSYTMLPGASCTYNTLKTVFEDDAVVHISITSHPYYNNSPHAIVGYGYSRLVSSTTGYYLTFVKLADGWDSSLRYMDLTSIQNAGATIYATWLS